MRTAARSGFRLEPFDLATLFPQLYGLAVDKLLGAAFGFLSLSQKMACRPLTILTDDVGVVTGHRVLKSVAEAIGAAGSRALGGKIAYFFAR